MTKKKSPAMVKLGCLAALLALAPSAVFCAHRDGNGGDHVRGTFISMGQAVIQYLKETSDGAQLVKSKGLDVPALEASLDIERIEVAGNILIDNGDSEVDAIGEPGKIQLAKDRWSRYFESGADVYYLVFHEMLRSVARNDDNYVISAAVSPFPATRRIVTQIASVIPLIDEDQLASSIDVSAIGVAGTGCPTQLEGTVPAFDLERNILDISLRRFQLHAGSAKPALDRKNCGVAIPVSAPAGKRVVITQIDVGSKLDLADGGALELKHEAFLTGSSGKVTQRSIKAQGAPQRGRALMRSSDALKSKCGGNDILRINAAAKLNSKTQDASSASVGRIVVYLRLESCS